jgi:RNA polymerase sigma-70 factor (ECF subfamily)
MDDHTRESRFDALYSAYSGEVLKYALRQDIDLADAEDVVVETFVVCWRRLDEVPAAALPWLLGVARRVVANQRRGAKRRHALYRRMVRAILVPPSRTTDSADRLDLESALAALNDRDREIISLVVWHGLTHEEAAEVIGCSRSTLTKRYVRACCRIRAQLSPDRTLDECEEQRSQEATLVNE